MSGRLQETHPGTGRLRGYQFGVLVREFRRTAGMTQRGLADLAGLSAGAVRDLEQGRTRSPKPASVRALAAALELSERDTEKLQAAAAAQRSASSPPSGATGRPYIGILGPIEVRYGDVPVLLSSGPQRTLLARLAISVGTTVSQDELVDLLWPRTVPANAVSLLHTRVARLRRLLAPDGAEFPMIVGSGNGYRLEASSETLDLLAFYNLVEKADVEGPAAALTKLSAAVALWRGETDVEAITASPLYIAISTDYAAAVRTLAAVAREAGEPELALTALLSLTARHALDEPLHVELIHTLAASDRQAEALAAYDRIRSALGEQLGVQPGERLRAAQLHVLRQHDDPAEERVVVQQTPSAPPDFVGRSDELTAIRTALMRPGATSSRVVLINGIAGVGKTALALEAAHHLRAEYPDGQLYADLRGSGSGHGPAAPAPIQVLGRFLRALGVPSRRIGTDETEAAALLRSELAGRRMLVLLDNAQDAAQIRLLLPGAGRSDVIVTSRRRLPGLDTVGVVGLEPLPQQEAVLLIAATARAHPLGDDAEGAAALAEACARLPLALRIAGARLATRPEWTVSDLTRRLYDGSRRLTELSVGESSVLNSFQLGYADLSPEAQRAFRLCDLHPGDDFSADSTGVLLGISAVEADQVLEDLLEANMLLQYTRNRYRFHDLLGLYAGRLRADDPESSSARARLLSWYADAVTAAMDRVYPQLVRLRARPEPVQQFATESEALNWLDDELPTLLAIVRQAAAAGDTALSWTIIDQLRGYFLLRREVEGWLPAAEAGLAAATAAGDDVARTAMLISRGQALSAVGQDEAALADCLAGEALATSIGWTAAAAYLAHHVGWFYLEGGKLADAVACMRRALESTENDQQGHVRAVAFNGLGMTRLYQGQLREAADLFSAALRINEATGRDTSALVNRGNLASAWRQLGAVDRSAELLGEVLHAYQERARPRGELSTLDELARLSIDHGDGVTALETALRAHHLATVIRDRKAQAQTAATVAASHLAAGDAEAAIEWARACLTIARDTYPYFETQALLALAAARRVLGDAASATEASEQAASIAAACGFALLEAEATADRDA
ncbi:BTAD domain-containing putative transcriptional regulator [Kribbella sp. CA-293567]|uniref:BTAD domain-containing putative transcriptional regulator n=1 Tax=Kribbella sp. CA-293567 TaxID=3002436 RepID=UPI0022DE340E|nr:BTAD domain-containing putative transcriptional regulator [Kribbella sp. CA-293567]WBQ08342.1 BTAD domain-containing putative transcriptional regulator [Kribbella sp. CA-293567]